MASFDIVSEVELQEVTNAVDQSNREVANRYDFKGTNASFELKDKIISMVAPTENLLKQMLSILRLKLGKRNVDVSCLQVEKVISAGRDVKQNIIVQQGIDKEVAKKMVKMVKDAKLKKIQASIHDDKVKVTGKKRDDLQEVISLFKQTDMGLPLQYINFRD